MKFVNKEELIEDLVSYLAEDAEIDETEVSLVKMYIENYKEEDCIKCGIDYSFWNYDVLTKPWYVDNNPDEVLAHTFCVVKKTKKGGEQ